MDGDSSSQLKSKFEENGYAIIKGFLTEDECDDLHRECHQIVEKMNPEEHSTVFSCDRQTNNDYFMNSADKVRFFFEKEALDEKGNLKVDKQMSLNKIGHALHVFSPGFRRITHCERVRNICRSLGLQDPVVCQSMVIFKPPHIGGEVNPHQDSSYLFTEPKRLVGIWIALEDTTRENSCLWFIPGSHKDGLAGNYRMIINPKKDPEVGTVFTGEKPSFDQSKFISGEVNKGDLVLIHGEVVHRSDANRSDKSRLIYTFHIYDEGVAKYSSQNWLQPTEANTFTHVYTFQ
ncbi:phytanoyl-CoA dioxygenase domain-containing protein 1-like [Gigantopelta aegis]|uniref:phytanoyl-CoA dioxygenase domain-containing protein 1-like n=1 Tax=Gigantopelta aegis TaxID=1735272 RepID=UPI001B88CC51|nr:phytanoyl-CoA dioxygenase domain-containing protein 1-like [Gigantopelta aegis]